jgi:hypothetical protein
MRRDSRTVALLVCVALAAAFASLGQERRAPSRAEGRRLLAELNRE